MPQHSAAIRLQFEDAPEHGKLFQRDADIIVIAGQNLFCCEFREYAEGGGLHAVAETGGGPGGGPGGAGGPGGGPGGAGGPGGGPGGAGGPGGGGGGEKPDRNPPCTDPGPLHHTWAITQTVQDALHWPVPYKTLDDENSYAPGHNDAYKPIISKKGYLV